MPPEKPAATAEPAVRAASTAAHAWPAPPAPAGPSVSLEQLLRPWPRPAGAAGPRLLAAAGAAALVAAVSVPLERPGLGVLVAALAGIAALAPAGGRPDAARVGWTAATVALAAVGTVRAADWLFALCLLAAAGTASLALTRGAGAYALTVRAVTLPAGMLRAPRWVGAGLRAAARGGRDRTAVLRTAATVAVTAILLLVFGGLLASADPAFGDLLDGVVPDVRVDTGVGRLVLFLAATAVLTGAAAVLAAPPDTTAPDRPARTVRPVEWAVPVGALVALFAAFVLVQVPVLFGGAAHVLRPGGPDYADYARGGFWQLLAVTVLTLAVLAAAATWAPRDRPADRLLVRLLLGALTALTLVIVASALSRMHTYEQAYGFTRLRVLVSVAELWLGSVLVLVLAAGVRLRGRWLPEAAVAAGVVALLGLAVLNPDRFVAERNIARHATGAPIDVYYLSQLSADAVPALDRLPAPLRGCALGRVARELARPDDWRAWNRARAGARTVLDRQPPSCP